MTVMFWFFGRSDANHNKTAMFIWLTYTTHIISEDRTQVKMINIPVPLDFSWGGGGGNENELLPPGGISPP